MAVVGARARQKTAFLKGASSGIGKGPTPVAFLRQLKAIADMARRIPGAELVIYEDAGHGGIFQNHADFVPKALSFLEA